MEKLYNNIILEDNFMALPNDGNPDDSTVPYLKNPPDVIDVTVGRQLFVDRFLVEETDLETEYHQPKKFEGNPVLKAEKPWEMISAPGAAPLSGGVWYDEQDKIYKMWYHAGWYGTLSYATSTDGIHWDRPDVGVVPGTNKIFDFQGYDFDNDHLNDVNYLCADTTTVWIDNDGPKDERYKLLLRCPGGEWNALGGAGCVVAVSHDGIHFRDFRLTSKTGDKSTMFYNPFRKKWVYSIRAGWGKSRMRRYRECDNYLDGAAWKDEEAPLWLTIDEWDREHPYINFKPQLYNVDAVGYESLMLGFFQIMYGPENDVTNRYGVPKITDLQFMYSRDGYHFSRPCRKSAIPSSMGEGTWDRGYIQSTGGAVIIHGDELWIYYAGFAGDPAFASTAADKDPHIIPGPYHNAATGLAKMRRDGFVSLNGKGSLLTRKLVFHGKETLHINADGFVQAELLDADGTVLAVSNPFCGDSTNQKLEFENFSVTSLNNKPIRIRFHVEGKLYAFGFADANGEFGGARAAGVAE